MVPQKSPWVFLNRFNRSTKNNYVHLDQRSINLVDMDATYQSKILGT